MTCVQELMARICENIVDRSLLFGKYFFPHQNISKTNCQWWLKH